MAKEKISPVGLSSGSIDADEFRRLLEHSNAVFDFANHAQTGYTMRIFENLCAGKKIITNNRRIEHEPFYSSDRILVLPENGNFSEVPEFLDIELNHPEETFPDYTIQVFAAHLANGTGHANPAVGGT